jgi:hypothetical protein
VRWLSWRPASSPVDDGLIPSAPPADRSSFPTPS